MKEATGELNMTVVTVVAIAAVGAFFYAFIWPGIRAGLRANTCRNICPGDATKVGYDAANDQCTCGDGVTLPYDNSN